MPQASAHTNIDINSATIATALRNYQAQHNTTMEQLAEAGHVTVEVVEKMMAAEALPASGNRFILDRMVSKLAPQLAKSHTVFATRQFVIDYQSAEQAQGSQSQKTANPYHDHQRWTQEHHDPELTEAIVKLRKKRHLTQAVWADVVGASVAHVQKVEGGTKDYTRLQIMKMARHLGCETQGFGEVVLWLKDKAGNKARGPLAETLENPLNETKKPVTSSPSTPAEPPEPDAAKPKPESHIKVEIPSERHAHRHPVVADDEWRNRGKYGANFVKQLIAVARVQGLTIKEFTAQLTDCETSLSQGEHPMTDQGAKYDYNRLNVMSYGANSVPLGLIQRAAWVLFRQKGDFATVAGFEAITQKIWEHDLEKSFTAKVRNGRSVSNDNRQGPTPDETTVAGAADDAGLPKRRGRPSKRSADSAAVESAAEETSPASVAEQKPRYDAERAVGIWISHNLADTDWLGFSLQINRQLRPDQWIMANHLKALASTAHAVPSLTLPQKRGFAQLMSQKDCSSADEDVVHGIIEEATRVLDDRRVVSGAAFALPKSRNLG